MKFTHFLSAISTEAMTNILPCGVTTCKHVKWRRGERQIDVTT